MNDKMALDLITSIMGWSEEQSTQEYAWLRLMSEVKYDGYADFRAGVRFLESLANWLKQFAPADRIAAYIFVTRRLVYISPPELQRLIESFLPDCVFSDLRTSVAAAFAIAPHEVWAQVASAKAFKDRLRKTLFVGMSDGSRIDNLRRANATRLTTEQVVPMMNVDDEKWCDLQEKLNEELPTDGGSSKFQDVYLIDDFTASGTTFIRHINGKWKGKLKRFNDLILRARAELKDAFPIAENYTLHVHHYVSSHQADQALATRLKQAEASWTEKSFGRVKHSAGLILPDDLPLSSPKDDAMLDLCNRYYDHALFKRLEKHCREAGQTDMKRGYADCALPVVLDHNTPNNSISLLWAETQGSPGHAMTPLFRRRDRHG